MARLPIFIRFLYTYPQPVTPKTGFVPWSNFNRYGWSIFFRRQQANVQSHPYPASSMGPALGQDR
jgi:hypothetical protein